MLSMAEKASSIIGCKGAARIEFMLDEQQQQEFYILEVNTHPGLTPLSSYHEILDFYGITFANFCEELLKTAAFEK
jgi:D-alanine-D-alanine ligase